MFDIVGKRRWFFLFSALITIPGLIFILLTPLTNGAGGPQVLDRLHRRHGVVDPVRGPERHARAGPRGARGARPGGRDGHADRARASSTSASAGLDLRELPTPTPDRPAPRRAAARAERGAAARERRRLRGAAPPARTGARPPTPAPTAPDADARADRVARADRRPPDPGLGRRRSRRRARSARSRAASQAKFGPIAEQAKLSSIGAVVSSDLVQQAVLLIFVGSLGILAWITLRFRDVKFGVTALVALLHDVIVVVGIFAILGTFFDVKIDGLFVTAMLTVIGFSVHDTIVVFDRDPREPGAPRRRAVRRDRQPLDPADVRPVDHDELHRRADADDAAPVRRRGDPGVRPRAAHRHRLGDVLVDLQRRAAARRLAGVGGPPPAAGSPTSGEPGRADGLTAA